MEWNWFHQFPDSSSQLACRPSSFVANGSVYLALPSRSPVSYLYRWNGASFALHQSFALDGIYSSESFIAENETFLVLSKLKGNTEPLSDVYKMTGSNFTLYQQLPTTGARDLVSLTHMAWVGCILP